jgi:Flp pilus assembly protein TadD
MLSLLALAALPLSACATTDRMALVEDGYERGALGVAAIDRGDYAAAEAVIDRKSGNVAADDPARLINLGTVYMNTGRPGMALSAWRLAAASDSHFMVATRDGRWVNTKDLAEQALARHGQAVRSATR